MNDSNFLSRLTDLHRFQRMKVGISLDATAANRGLPFERRAMKATSRIQALESEKAQPKSTRERAGIFKMRLDVRMSLRSGGAIR
jgi:hypothetical protein